MQIFLTTRYFVTMTTDAAKMLGFSRSRNAYKMIKLNEWWELAHRKTGTNVVSLLSSCNELPQVLGDPLFAIAFISYAST